MLGSLKVILTQFRECKNIFNSRDDSKKISTLFDELILSIDNLGSEKLTLPREFRDDTSLYLKGDRATLEKFEDIENRYLMLSDLYDYLRVKKLI